MNFCFRRHCNSGTCTDLLLAKEINNENGVQSGQLYTLIWFLRCGVESRVEESL